MQLTLASTNINFPNLGITLKNVASGITIHGFTIAFYGMVIAFGMIMGYLLSERLCKKTGLDPELALDFVIWGVLMGVVGARAYYCIFNWDAFSDNPVSVLNLRTGGLAIYGGIIGGVLAAVVFCRIRKVYIPAFMDIGLPGICIGQIIGRWGNFFNREAFGTYTDGLFAMQIDVTEVNRYFNPATPLSEIQNAYQNQPQLLKNILEIREHAVTIDGATYIQVQPTFLYESLLNLCLLLIILLYVKHRKFRGELALIYFMGYGLIRFWIEKYRTDPLLMGNTAIPVSRLLSAVLFTVNLVIFIIGHIRVRKNRKEPEPVPEN